MMNEVLWYCGIVVLGCWSVQVLRFVDLRICGFVNVRMV